MFCAVLFSRGCAKPHPARIGWAGASTDWPSPKQPSTSSALRAPKHPPSFDPSPYSFRTLTIQTRTVIHSRTTTMSASLNNSKDPVERTSSPYTDPRELGPKSKILASRKSNYHSTSLRNMVSNTVNKTALHPGGVQYVSPLNLSKTPLLAISGI